MAAKDEVDLNNLNAYFSKGEEMIRILGENNTKESMVKIVNISGQLIYKAEFIKPESVKINTSNWKRGIYLVAITRENSRRVLKLQIN